jgi:transcriptional regulator with XRE-family HTH domain
MNVKSFDQYLKKRLDKEEIKALEQAAKLEFEALKALQHDIAKAITQYMSDSNIGFNEFVRKCGKSPAQVSKIIKGEANVTLATIAQLYAVMGRTVHIVTN